MTLSWVLWRIDRWGINLVSKFYNNFITCRSSNSSVLR